ncbi:MAG TPA: mechanosensitive ion channel domain-containing protein [Acetobacteraceae bacterium]|nr:mechanosensitive ion channel domain-containing protein [Acetobacteraceae bacterium]
MSRLLILAWMILLAFGFPVRAQPPAPAAPQITAAEAQQALSVLQDSQKRAQYIAVLETLARTAQSEAPAAKPAEPAPPPAPAPSPPPDKPAITVAPHSLGAEVLFGASRFLNHVTTEAVGALGAIRSVPLLWNWLRMMATDPWARGVQMDIAWRLALALVAGFAVQWAIRRSVARPIRSLAGRAPNGSLTEDENGEARAEEGEIEPPRRRITVALVLLRRLPLVAARLMLELLPVLGFFAVGHLIAATSLGGDSVPRLVIIAVVDATALCGALLATARMMLSPGHPRLRLLSLSDEAAAYLMRWIRRIVIVSVFGYAAAEVGLLLGLTYAAHDGLLKAIGLLDHIFLGIIVIQRRRTVRNWLKAPDGATGAFAAVRNWLARVWHWIALLVLATLWLAWVVEVPHGYQLMFRYAISLVFVAAVARVLQIALLGALDRALTPRPDLVQRFPGLDVRLAMYHPVLVSVVRAFVFLAAAVTVLQFWGLGTFDWLATSRLGQHLVSSLLTLSITLLLSVAVWEAVNASIQRHLTRLTQEAQVARSARLRTLLPLLRSSLLITIIIVAGMMVLSEIGVNIGPLLAGAGIIGVAIGFGSQKLVQDLITGIFLLLENAMQVGDSVTVSGLSGTVENLSVRTIRLRASDGSVHIIPFSSVTSVTNVNRGIGNASVNVAVAWREDSDHVSGVLKDIVGEMQQEPDFAKKMLSDLQLWGVDKVDGASLTITGQVVCTDSGRWSVQREFNRRMKKRFEELGIELYNPIQKTVSVRRAIEDRRA